MADSTPDGPRFVASLQDIKDKCLYKDFFESEKLGETKLRAESAMIETGRATLIFDRVEHAVIDRFKPEVEETKEVPKKEEIPKKRKK